MNEKERYHTKIEAQISSMNQTIEEIAAKMKLKEDMRLDIDIESLLKKHKDANSRLKKLEALDENKWQKVRREMDALLEGIDRDLRKAMAYFG